MANAAAKRIAGQNETAVRNLRIGLLLPTIISLLLRFLFRRSSLPPSIAAGSVYIAFSLPAWLISQYLIKIGTVKRDPTTKILISSGEDLNQAGVTEWCFDVVYITYMCQISSGVFGERAWWLYSVIPLYAVFKVVTTFIAPNLFSRSSSGSTEESESDSSSTLSKRQEKLKKRGAQTQKVRVR